MSSNNSDFFIHLFETRASELEGKFCSPRRDPQGYARQACVLPDPLSRKIVWYALPAAGLYQELFPRETSPRKGYRVYSLHRLSALPAKTEKYQGSFLKIPDHFSLYCDSSMFRKFEKNPKVEIISQREVSTGTFRITLKAPLEIAYPLVLASLERDRWMPRVEEPKVLPDEPQEVFDTKILLRSRAVAKRLIEPPPTKKSGENPGAELRATDAPKGPKSSVEWAQLFRFLLVLLIIVPLL